MNYKDYLELKEQFDKQKKLEKYQRSRPLSVPKTQKIDIVILCVIFVILISSIIVGICNIPINNWLKTTFIAIVGIAFLEFGLRILGIKIVECYQHYASEKTRRRCLCVPSCSEYAIMCLKKYEIIKAMIKIRKRLYITCKGDDYKIDLP